MTAQLSSHKRLLTQHCKKLQTVLSRFKGEKLETLRATEEDRTPGYERESRKKLQEGLGTIEACTTKIEQLWQKYGSTLDQLDNPAKSEMEDYELYSAQIEGVLSSAFDYTILLEGRLRAFTTSTNSTQGNLNVSETHNTQQKTSPGIKKLDLPTVPIPTFTGNIWDWDNFWVLFSANVHSQPLPSLFKFNYLLNALKGEPYNAVKKFQVTEENYQKAVNFLQAKYGNKEELVNRLIDRLENLSSRSQLIKDQRVLLEQIQVIVSQLHDKGEQIDGQLLLKQILSKFAFRLQRKVLEKKHSTEGTFRMENLLKSLDEIIASEEQIALYTTKTSRLPYRERPHKEQFHREEMSAPNSTCMYCRAGHKSGACTKYATPQERARYLREHGLCFICASSNHFTSQCKGQLCFRCQGKHHTSCCFKSDLQPKGDNTTVRKASAPLTTPKDKGKTAQKPSTTSTNNHHVSNTETAAILHNKLAEQPQTERRTRDDTSCRRESFLPTGEFTVMEPQTRTLRKIAVLLDSGAEFSFIDKELAEELKLPTIEITNLRLRTFGSDRVQECTCRRVPLEVWDCTGKSYSLELLTHDNLITTLKCPPVLEEDVKFLNTLQLPVKLTRNHTVTKPLVLLGCDQLWQLLCMDQAHIPLPSGLNLLPTHLGHLLTGQITRERHDTRGGNKVQNEDYLEDEGEHIEEAQVHALSLENKENKAYWEKYWSQAQEDSEEFTRSENEIRSLIDQKVMEDFENSIEKREDGYYVRLPWKEAHIALPDNRTIALRRLVSVWTSLQKDKELLEKYNEIFQEQLRSNIIEEVIDEREPVTGRIHYLPHQAVITPQKNTTKLRIVFDASAHFKNSPSLNDALHRGPVILPKLYGILIRFRFGRIALSSDVEKAFLQVRLQQVDRDATRCLWLHDHKSPPSTTNVRVFRFTRVTFGLLPSPFLLAATTHYHLDQYPNDAELVRHIKENLYVDNLFLTVDTENEANRVYTRTKTIFNELKMNLREFLSNDSSLMETIPEQDRSTERNPKVLGVQWCPSRDVLKITCKITAQENLTKRTIASTIASIYDPMGWMLPLVHKAKTFLQNLWRKDAEWDTPLSEDRKSEWAALVDEMQGFEKELPRFLIDKSSAIHLVTFADASAEAMAACTYVCANRSANLLMAKGKLPNSNSKMTIPKMELNALTIAARLTSAIITQIQSVTSIESILLMTDSEVALNWIRSDPRKDSGPFVRNRVLEIHNIVNHLEKSGYIIQFGHIPSQSNPADCATRGLNKTPFKEHFWWKGPSFLALHKNEWSNNYKAIVLEKSSEGEEMESPETLTEGITTVEAVTRPDATHTDLFQGIRFSDFPTIKRVVVHVMRFIRLLTDRVNKHRAVPIVLSDIFRKLPVEESPIIRGTEIMLATKMLAKQHQLSYLNGTILKSLHHLGLYLDEDSVYRCRGRLGKSDLEESAKFPILVLQKSWLSNKIITECHSALHLSTSHTMCRVRQSYWIPQLRAEVTKIIRRCTPCQKLNNLPYKYPDQDHLPPRRVTRSRPFAHVGLDYFGPLAVKNENQMDKCYGCIITCLVTRLIHLDVVTNVSTVAFLHMLRRFFSRRGVPISITSDNSPTFTLGDTILSECFNRMRNDVTIAKELSDRQINWNYITPYAPWQGGVYERLIQSVKSALHKSLGKATPTREELDTLIIEIEGMLNTRPLLYVDSESEADQVLRPIDFLQNEFETPPTLEVEDDNELDPAYIDTADYVGIQTKNQALQALKSSCHLTERFWQIWQTQYITSLREKHQKTVGKKRGSRFTPQPGKIVLIGDALQPRYQWKMGRILELVKNNEGVVREAIVLLPSRRKIRRPVNLLTPLELDNEESGLDKQTQGSPRESDTTPNMEEVSTDLPYPRHNQHTSRYELRPRKKMNYREDGGLLSVNTGSILFVALVSMLIGICSGSTAKAQVHHEKHIRCTQGGVEIKSTDQLPYEVCAEDYCKRYASPNGTESIRFPPEIILHEYSIQVKFIENSAMKIIETSCPPAPFCDHLDCTFCSTLLFNPECWPVGAIGVTALILYFLITGCYAFLYVPIVIGRPVRCSLSLLRYLCVWLVKIAWRRVIYVPRRRTRDLLEILAVATILISAGEGCQQINLFAYHGTVCTTSENKEICKIRLSEILKINPYKREACFRLKKNSTILHEIRVAWKTLMLTCEPETDYFTRDTVYRVIDSKRCPHTGSCVGHKCAGINHSSTIPELEQGNAFPGTTYCVESCGGPGCDCFYWSSGCLFYRVYAVPKSEQIFEVFHCNGWKEAIKMQFIHFNVLRNKKSKLVAHMLPNVPITWGPFEVTVSSITVPPTPLLSTSFIRGNNNTALWDPRLVPALICSSSNAAANLECDIKDGCTCYPAETKVNCKCGDISIADLFLNLQYQFPVVTPTVTFRENQEGYVQALISTMATSEIVLTIQDEFETSVVVDGAFCSVTNAVLTGCYSCAKGAQARVICKSSRSIQAEIVCDDSAFVIDCDEKGAETVLRFTFDRARIMLMCAVSCGGAPSTFEIGGILKFTYSAQSIIDSWIEGRTNSLQDIQWPDVFHIADTFLQWYKTLALALAALLIMIIITYIFITTCGTRVLVAILQLVMKPFKLISRVCFRRTQLPIPTQLLRIHEKLL